MNALFDRLVATEAAVRLDYVYRRQAVTLHDFYGPEEYSVADPDKGGHPYDVADNLSKAFTRIYDYIFADSSQHHKLVAGRVCNTRDLTFEARAWMRKIFQTFAGKNYDLRGGLRLAPEQGPEILKALYERLRDEVPLHNSSLACGALFVQMGRGEKWRELFPRGIDFARGEPVPEAEPSRFLSTRFHDAFFGDSHSPPSSRFIDPPESKVRIAGLGFISKTIQGWRTHLVTQTGHMVDLTDGLRSRIEQHILSGKPLDALRVDIHEAWRLADFVEGFAQNPEEQALRQMVKERILRMSESQSVDGLPAKDERGQARLMCMDVDFLTGLLLIPLPGQEKSDLERFKAFMSETLKVGNFAALVPADFTANLRTLSRGKEREAKRRELTAHLRLRMRKLKVAARAHKDPSLENLVAIAVAHLVAMMPIVYEASDKPFLLDEGQDPACLRPLPQPGEKRMYMTMGGSASGKSSLKRIAEGECDGGRSLVVASLDDSRSECDRYWLYPATDNHNDDYRSAEHFGSALRDLIALRALSGGHHLFIDASGIPYEGRHDKTTKLFKDHGYHVSVLAAQAPLFVHDPQRRRELAGQGSAPDDALARLGARQARELRGLNPKIVADKHIKFPLASRNAARDNIVDRFMIQDVTSLKDRYTLSYVLTLGKEETERLAQLKGVELLSAIKEGGLVPPWATLPSRRGQEHLYNIKVIRANLGDESYRVEIITDIEQYICMVEKGLLKRDAEGPEALYDYVVHADLEGLFQGPDGKLKTLGAKGVGERVLDQYLPFSERPKAQVQP